MALVLQSQRTKIADCRFETLNEVEDKNTQPSHEDRNSYIFKFRMVEFKFAATIIVSVVDFVICYRTQQSKFCFS